MNKKGFTLIELIVTIALLAVVALVSFVSITKVINESRNKECKNMETTIINAAKSYVSDNRYNNSWDCDSAKTNDLKITAKILYEEHHLTKTLRNPYTGKDFTNSELEAVTITIDLDSSCQPISVAVKKLPKNCQS